MFTLFGISRTLTKMSILNWILKKRSCDCDHLQHHGFTDAFNLLIHSWVSRWDNVVGVGPTAGANYWQGNLSFYLRVFTEILFNKNIGYIKHTVVSVYWVKNLPICMFYDIINQIDSKLLMV